MELNFNQVNEIRNQLIEYFNELQKIAAPIKIFVSNKYLYDFIINNVEDNNQYMQDRKQQCIDLKSATILSTRTNYCQFCYKNPKTYLTELINIRGQESKKHTYIIEFLIESILASEIDPFYDFHKTVEGTLENNDDIIEIAKCIGKDNALKFITENRYDEEIYLNLFSCLDDGYLENSLVSLVLKDFTDEVGNFEESIESFSLLRIEDDGLYFYSDGIINDHYCLPFLDNSICIHNKSDNQITFLTEKDDYLEVIQAFIDTYGSEKSLTVDKYKVEYGCYFTAINQDFAAEKGICEIIEMYAYGSDIKTYKKLETNNDKELKPDEPKRRNKNKP